MHAQHYYINLVFHKLILNYFLVYQTTWTYLDSQFVLDPPWQLNFCMPRAKHTPIRVSLALLEPIRFEHSISNVLSPFNM